MSSHDDHVSALAQCTLWLADVSSTALCALAVAAILAVPCLLPTAVACHGRTASVAECGPASPWGIPKTLIIVPMDGNRSAPGPQKSPKSPPGDPPETAPQEPTIRKQNKQKPLKIDDCSRNDSKVLMVLECIVLEDGLGGCCFRGVPGGYFWAIVGAPEPNN